MTSSSRIDTVMKITNGVIGVVVAISLAFAVWVLTRPDPYNPLSYPPQRVVTLDENGVESIPFVEGFSKVPAVHLDSGVVPVSGQTCSTASTPVQATAFMWWERMEPAGRRLLVLDEFPTVVDPGCQSWHLTNDIPPQLADIPDAEQWRITGSVTPTAPGGVTTTFTTETFWVVP